MTAAPTSEQAFGTVFTHWRIAQNLRGRFLLPCTSNGAYAQVQSYSTLADHRIYEKREDAERALTLLVLAGAP